MVADNPDDGVVPLPGMDQPTPSSEISAKVDPPAIALLVTAGIGIAMQLLGLVINMLGMGFAASTGEGAQALGQLAHGGLAVVSGILGIICGVVVILGALKMRSLQNYGLAMAAAIVAMVPCVSPCCVLGLPIGIWALVILTQEDVKRAFAG